MMARVLGLRWPGQPEQPETGSGTEPDTEQYPAPGPGAAEAEPEPQAGSAVPGPEPAAVPEPGSGGTAAGVVIRTGRERAAVLARRGAGMAGSRLHRYFRTPGSAGHALYHYAPRSLAEHDDFIRSRTWVKHPKGERAIRRDEIQLRTVGRALKACTNMGSALAESVTGQRITLAAFAAIAIAFAVLVF